MHKRKNRPHPRAVKRLCVESDDTLWFAFMYFILSATLAFCTYLIMKLV